MNLCFSALLLSAGSFLRSSALTPEECQPWVTPLPLADPSTMYGRSNFILGYTDYDLYKALMKTFDSLWLTFSASSPDELVMSQKIRVNGTCLATTANFTIDGNAAKMSHANETSAFHVLQSCDGCLVISINTTIGDTKSTKELVTAHGLYLLARDTSAKDSDMERFKQQAECLGFSGEPAFHYDAQKEFCREGESFRCRPSDGGCLSDTEERKM